MERQYLESVAGSPPPADIFQPHMPGVDVLTNMDELFDLMRRELLHAETVLENSVPGQRAVAILTPGRITIYQPCPPPGSLPAERLEPFKRFLPPEPVLNISVVSYTLLEAFMTDATRLKCIPFLGILLAYAYIGHSVVIFEGHPTAFASGVRNSDVLIVDSGMLPFLQADWLAVARQVMRPTPKVLYPAPKVFICDRQTLNPLPVVPSNNEQGWQYAEPDGEPSYANCLLMMLAKGRRPSVQITSGQPLPDLIDFTTDPADLAWVKALPFKYDRLDADKVIDIILQAAGRQRHQLFRTSWVLTARLVDTNKESKMVSFNIKLTKGTGGRRQLQIER